jgi:cAMP-dependent protein kinase regulator
MEHYSSVPLFKGLAPEEIMRLLKIAKDVAAAKGDLIVREGDAGDGFFVIAKGAFEVRKRRAGAGPEEEGALLARLGEFSFFGEMSLVTFAPRAATVACVDEGRLKKFPTESFEKLLAGGDIAAFRVVRNMCTILAERLARMGERFVSEGPARS